MPLPTLATLALLALVGGRQPSIAAATPAEALDAFHAAAAAADGDAYFEVLTEDVIVIGTDPGERWDRAAFRAFCEPYFSRGIGWTYVAVERNVSLAPDGTHAWFDESLDNASYGRCRGTGVLRRTPGGWRIAQYCYTIPIPNDLARDTVARIRRGADLEAAADDHRSIDAALAAVYETISGDAGVPRDWDRFRRLFTEDARLAALGPAGPDGERRRRTMTVDEYIDGASRMFAARGFHERQTSRRIVRYGHIAHAFSTYESRTGRDDPEPFDRGINSIQLVDTGAGWRVVSILWETESTAGPVDGATSSRIAAADD
jgi:ketosteroid isomerase-like protein